MELNSTVYPNPTRTIIGLLNTPFQNDVVLLCDTSLGAVEIELLSIPANYWSTQYKLHIVDKGTASVNNITIKAPLGYTINGVSSVVIAVDGGSYLIRVGSNSDYLGQYSASNIALTSLPIYNTVFVAKNGSDLTGLPERLDKPFLTIAGAMASAVTFFAGAKLPSITNRILIKVFSGQYIETIVLKDFIDLDLADSVITSPSNANIITDSNQPVNSIIYGSANLFASSTQGDNVGISISNASSVVSISVENISISSTSPATVRGVQCFGALTLNFNNLNVTANSSSNCFGIDCQGTVNANAKGYVLVEGTANIVSLLSTGVLSKLYFLGNNVTAFGGGFGQSFALSSQNSGKSWITCNNVYLTLAVGSTQSYCSAISSLFDASEMYVVCNEIITTDRATSPLISCCQIGSALALAPVTTSAILKVNCYQATIGGTRVDSRAIYSQNNTGGCIANFKGRYVISKGALNTSTVELYDDGVTTSGAIVILDNVTLIAVNAGKSVISTVAKNIFIYGGCQSNKAVDVNITEVVTSIVFNGAVI